MVRVTGTPHYQFGSQMASPKTVVLYTHSVPVAVADDLLRIHADMSLIVMRTLLHAAFYVSAVTYGQCRELTSSSAQSSVDQAGADAG